MQLPGTTSGSCSRVSKDQKTPPCETISTDAGGYPEIDELMPFIARWQKLLKEGIPGGVFWARFQPRSQARSVASFPSCSPKSHSLKSSTQMKEACKFWFTISAVSFARTSGEWAITWTVDKRDTRTIASCACCLPNSERGMSVLPISSLCSL